MNNEPQIYGYMVLVMVSIAFFNFSGVSITKYMSATTRKVLDTLRTMVIWICQMLLHQVMMMMMMMITSLPYFEVKPSCVCLMFAYRKNSL